MFDSFASNSKFDFVGKWYDAATGLNKWIETEASITACVRGEAAEEDYFVTYTYQVNGKRYDGHYRDEVPVDVSDPLSVRYKPSSPERSYFSGSPSGRAPLVLIAIGLGFGAFWLILHLMSRGYY